MPDREVADAFRLLRRNGISAEEVIRCGNCKHWQYDPLHQSDKNMCDLIYDSTGRIAECSDPSALLTDKSFYCALAEKGKFCNRCHNSRFGTYWDREKQERTICYESCQPKKEEV